MPDLIEEQIELEKKMTQLSIDNYRRELEKAKQGGNFGCTSVASQLISRVLDDFVEGIREYIGDFKSGKAIRSTIAADVITRLGDLDVIAYLTCKTILNSVMTKMSIQALYKAIGQSIEDEYKMREYKQENSHYYKSIQEDLNRRGAKANRKKNITTGVFNKRLDFHLDKWSMTEKFQTGMVLTKIFVETTGIVEFEDVFKKKRHYKYVIPTKELITWIDNMNEKLEVMQPLFLPMVCQPKEWTGVFEGGYISPYLKRNKLVKNNSKEYLQKLQTASMPLVYEAINHLQNTQWQVNKRVLDVVKALWEEGRAVAELPDREDEPLIPFPYPDREKDTVWNEEEIEVVKKWKRDTYEIHKRNVQKRSVRLLVSNIIRIATQFEQYESIYFPYQMDFRGRLYPIPVLLQPQGSDLAKGLLHFARGKPIDSNSIKWLQIHGANVFGYDKESYDKRIEWTRAREQDILSYVQNPLLNRGWTQADKPFQFLAFCYEYSDYLNNPDTFRTHIPIQLDGTCNGLQHYSALLRDEIGGKTVNLINSDKPNDIYATVAHKLEEKLNVIKNSGDFIHHNNGDLSNNGNNKFDNSNLAKSWLTLGINRKLTKRPVMVLPYGGTLLSCREYIQEYLTDNYSPNFIWKHFGYGDNPNDCAFKVSSWLSKYLWQSIQDTLKSAIVGMDYLKKVARIVSKKQPYIEWLTPAGLLVHQAYKARKHKEIKTELFGSILKVNVNIDQETPDIQRQLNGICPNFIHSLDAACLMLYLVKCKQAGIEGFMTVHDCYGTYAGDTDMSAKLLRESFVEIYRQPILENFTQDVLSELEVNEADLPQLPQKGSLDIEDVLHSDYFFN